MRKIEPTVTRRIRGVPLRAIAVVLGLCTIIAGLTGCNNNTLDTSSYFGANQSDCLPDIKLVDQYGQRVSLASLKGKPVLFDFFYTSCPGPCLVLTARMRSIAQQLGDALGSQVSFVSVTVDPEHDTPPQLLAYAKEQGANRKGWLFVTGSPAAIDQVMARFKLRRQRESDGSVDHVLEFFLIGADGHPIYQYMATQVNTARIAGDIEQAEHNGVAGNAANRSEHGLARASGATIRLPA
jgi:protein SCO1